MTITMTIIITITITKAMYRELQTKCQLCEELSKHRREDAKTLAEVLPL